MSDTGYQAINCPFITASSNTSTIYSIIQQEIYRLSEIGKTISDENCVYSPIGPVRNLLLLWLNIKYGNLLLSPYISEYNGFTYTIDENDNVKESESDILNNQKVYLAINIYFQDTGKNQVGVSITYVNLNNPKKNHNSVVIIRKNDLSYKAFQYETYGLTAGDLLPGIHRTSGQVIKTSLERLFPNNITVYPSRSPTLNQAIIQQIQNKNEGGRCIALSLFVIYLSFFSNKQEQTLSPGGTNFANINIECFNIPEDVQLNCIRGFMKEASDGIIPRLYPLGNLATAFSITELSKYHILQDQRINYLNEILKYIIDGYKNWRIDLGLPGHVTGTITNDDLTELSQKNIEVEKGKILGLFMAAKNSTKRISIPARKKTGKFTEKVEENIRIIRNGNKKKGGSTKKNKKKKSKRRKTKRKKY